YSVLNASTPSTPTASTAYSRLSRPGNSGSSWGPRAGVFASVSATMVLIATGVTTATSIVQKVERTEKSLVHSQASTSRARAASGTLVAVIGRALLPVRPSP